MRIAFSPKIFNRICDEIANGKSLLAVCRRPDMPNRRTFERWCERDPALKARYDDACRAREDVIFEEILEIADDTTYDTTVTDHGEQPNSEWISRSRLRVDARKWVLARMNRKKYGDKVDSEIDVKGEIKTITRRIVDQKRDDEDPESVADPV